MDATVGDSKAAPLDLSHHFARSTPSRKESSIKEFYKFFAIPDIGNLAGGKTRPLAGTHRWVAS